MPTLSRLRDRWFAPPSFYKKALAVAVPIMLQNAVTNFVNLLDNIMIGQVGTMEMSGVSIANQLLFIFNISIFGCVNAAGIFSAQYCGRNDADGVRNCFRLKLLLGLAASLTALCIFTLKAEALISLYLNPELNDPSQIAYTLTCSKQYLGVMLWGLAPFAFSQCIASTMRDDGDTVYPMRASFAAVAINFVFNWLLIFGHFGFPKLGITGAALATVLSRFAELFYLTFLALKLRQEKRYFHGVFRHFSIPGSLAAKVAVKGTPLVVNELLWSLGIAGISQCYSTRGLDAVAACNIYSTVNNLFLIVCIGMGSAIGIIVGQLLGAGKTQEAVETDRRLIVFAVLLSAATGLIMILSAPLFPKMYNTTETVRSTAASLLRIAGLMMPVSTVCNATYFTLRCGGKTLITFLSDSVFTCMISWTLALVLSRFTALPVVMIVFFVSAADLIKAGFGLLLVEKGVWINNLVARI